MTEDIIDLAQRVLVKQDGKLEREMDLMTRLRDQTWKDLQVFVREREKKRWRNWQVRGFNYKPDVFNREKLLADLTKDVESQLLQVEYIEPRCN